MEWVARHTVYACVVGSRAYGLAGPDSDTDRRGVFQAPTVLECLSSPLVETVTEVGRELLALRPAFLSRRVAATYGNYATDQLNRLRAARHRGDAPVNWKQAMHMVRLLHAGIHVLRTGEVLVDVSAYRDELLAVKAGEVTWRAVTLEAARLHADLTAAAATTALPPEPDRATVETFLIRARRRSLEIP